MDGKKIIVLLVLLVTSAATKAQTVQDYFFKSWDLTYISPAALAADTSMIGNMTYGRDAVGGVQANVGGQVQLHTGFESGHGVGIAIQSSRTGIFTSNSIGAGYAYRVRLSENQSLSAGGRFTYFKYSLDRASVVHSNVDDPVLYGDMFQQSSLLISTGLLYQVGQFRLAVNAPDMLPIEGSRYTKRKLNVYADYGLQLHNWEIRPNLYFERLEALGDWFESGLYVSYDNRIAAEISYTSENALRGKASVNFNKITVGYGYNAGKTGKEGSESQIGHRLYIGYNFGNLLANSKARKAQVLKEKNKLETILNDQVQLISDFQSTLNQTEESHRKMVDEQEAAKAAEAAEKERLEAERLARVKSESKEATKSKRGYYVAIASFDTMRRVNIFMAECQKKGMEPRVIYIPHEKKYRVYVGSFSRFSKSLEIRDRLRKQGFHDSWVFEIK